MSTPNRPFGRGAAGSCRLGSTNSAGPNTVTGADAKLLANVEVSVLDPNVDQPMRTSSCSERPLISDVKVPSWRQLRRVIWRPAGTATDGASKTTCTRDTPLASGRFGEVWGPSATFE